MRSSLKTHLCVPNYACCASQNHKKVTFIVFHNESKEDESTSEEDDDDYEEDESIEDEISDNLVAKKKVRILFSVDLFGHEKIIIIICIICVRSDVRSFIINYIQFLLP